MVSITLSDYVQPQGPGQSNILEGEFCVAHSFVSDLFNPSQLGRIQLPPNTLSLGTKVLADNTEAILREKVDDQRPIVLTGGKNRIVNNALIKPLSARYLVCDTNGVAFPFGEEFYPSGVGHTLIFDPHAGCVRSLSLRECWFAQGGISPGLGLNYPPGSRFAFINYSLDSFTVLFGWIIRWASTPHGPE